MNIEQTAIKYLEEKLDVPVFADVPKKRPDEFVTVERAGGSLANVVIDHASIVIQSWAKTRHDASELAISVDLAMHCFVDEKGVSNVERNAGPYNFPDPDNTQARYQSLYEIIFL